MRNIFHEAKAMIDNYSLLSKQNSFPLLPSVRKLQSLIRGDSLIRMNLELAISNSPQTLKGMSISNLLSILNAGIHEPPAFTLYPLVGSPVGSVFAEMMQTENGRNLFAQRQFNNAVREMLIDYNRLLRSEVSLRYMNQHSPEGWMCQQAKRHIDYSQFQCDMHRPHYGFTSWNDFFTRKFKKGARPIYGQGNKLEKNIIINSCEAFAIESPSMPVTNIQRQDTFWLKDQNYSLKDIFGASRGQSQYYSQLFEGGTIYQGFLDAFYYHRWHSPVDGKVEANYLIQGHYMVDRSQFTPKELDSFKIAQSFLASVATRRIIVIDPENEETGKIGLVYIGMADISSCQSDVKIGEKVKKGEDIGHFEIGGSSHAIIFQKKAKLKFNENIYDHNKKANLLKVNSFLAELI